MTRREESMAALVRGIARQILGLRDLYGIAVVDEAVADERARNIAQGLSEIVEAAADAKGDDWLAEVAGVGSEYPDLARLRAELANLKNAEVGDVSWTSERVDRISRIAAIRQHLPVVATVTFSPEACADIGVPTETKIAVFPSDAACLRWAAAHDADVDAWRVLETEADELAALAKYGRIG